MIDEIKKLQKEVEKIRSQLYIFYELTKAMRTTLHLDEIAYIILTGLTAHQGLGFNRAVLFLTASGNKKINGFMGIGSVDGAEADTIWKNIKDEKKDLYDLIESYRPIKEGKVRPKFMELVRSLSFSTEKENGILSEILSEKGPIYFASEEIENSQKDPLISKLHLKDFLAASLWIKEKPAGLIIVDNSITQKPINEEDIKIFNMFVEQACGAIENSQIFENTLTRSHTDSLTSLWNHGYFQYKLDEELQRAKANNESLSIMMVDLDDFKKFNDTFGHIEGDKALKKIAEIFRENCRKVDIICRYGGEEFSLIIPSASKEEAFYLAQRIRESTQNNSKHKFTISVGIASFPKDGDNKAALIEKADKALYAAKNQGKNRVVLA
ncbi:MAG: sensor domain-containing diguanylate cyclase [Candidatus Omnitrophica bacterium]|nr:sensor domain-containing diguanylate cyclase [Candidatus Omnitrophota bacterium]